MAQPKLIKLSGLWIYPFLLMAAFLFFVFLKSSVAAQTTPNLPIDAIIANCETSKNSTPDNCIDTSPAGPSLHLTWFSWSPQETSYCGAGGCTFRIFRKEGDTGVFQPIVSNVDDFFYLDKSDLKSRILYYYIIEAVNQQGEVVAKTQPPGSRATRNCVCPNTTGFVIPPLSNDCSGNQAYIKITWPKVYAGPFEAASYKIYRWDGAAPAKDLQTGEIIYQGNLQDTINSNSPGINFDGTPRRDGSTYIYKDRNSIFDNPVFTYIIVARNEVYESRSLNYETWGAGKCPGPRFTQTSTNEPDCSPPTVTLEWVDCEGNINECRNSRFNYSLFRDNSNIPLVYLSRTSSSSCHGVSRIPACSFVPANNRIECCYDDSTAVRGATHSYFVKTEKDYWSLSSSPVSESLESCGGGFDPPDWIGVNSACFNGQPAMQVTWSYVTKPQPAGITLYYIYRQNCGSDQYCLNPSEWLKVSQVSSQYETWRDNNVTAGMYYNYQVRAITNTDQSNPSDAVMAQARTVCNSANPPLPVPNLITSSGCYSIQPQITLNWKLPKVPDRFNDIYYYYIFRLEGNNINYLDSIPVGGYASQDNDYYYYSYKDTYPSIQPGQTYTYRLTVLGSSNPVDSNTSQSAALDNCAIPDPFNLDPPAAECNSGIYTVNLAWTESLKATDYEIFEKSSNSPPSTINCNDIAGKIATQSATNPRQFSKVYNNITQDTTYYYFVRAKITGSDKCTLASYGQNSVTLSPNKPPKPSPPTYNTYCDPTSNTSTIELSWAAVPGAMSGYKLWAKGLTEPSFHIIYSGYSRSFKHLVNSGATFQYYLTAGGCSDSDPSNTITVTSASCLPGKFSITGGTKKCLGDNNPRYTFNWAASIGAESYEVYRDSDTNLLTAPDLPNTTFSYTDYPQDNIVHYYYVKAENPQGKTQSTNSFLADMDCTPPGPFNITEVKTDLDCVAGYPKIKIFWSASSGAKSYNIYRCEGSGCPPNTLINTSAITALNYVDAGGASVAPFTGHIYRYQIKAFKAVNVGETTSSNIGEGTARDCPLLPFNLNLDASCDMDRTPIFSLGWASPSGDINHYEVYRSKDSANNYVLIATRNVRNYQDNNVENTADYYYYVRAVTNNNQSVNSNTEIGQMDCRLPPAPALNSATSQCSPENDHYVQLVWAWESDGSPATYFKISRNSNIIATISLDKRSYNDSGAASGATPTYKVLACNTSGCSESNSLDTTPKPTLYCQVGQPASFLAASRCKKQAAVVELSWQKAQNAAGYYLIRKIGADTDATYALDSSITSKTDETGITVNTDYTYELVAYNPTHPCNNCLSCPSQCATAQVSTLSCEVGAPEISVQKICKGDASNPYYGTYFNISWVPDELNLGPPQECKLYKLDSLVEAADSSNLKTSTFHSHGIYPAAKDKDKIDNVASVNYNNSTYSAAASPNFYKFADESVFLNRYSSPSLNPNIKIDTEALPAAGRDVTLDFWFNTSYCVGALPRSILFKDSGDEYYDGAYYYKIPDFNVLFNYTDNELNTASSTVMTDSPYKPKNATSNYTVEELAPIRCGQQSDRWHHFLWSQDLSNKFTRVFLDSNLVYEGTWSRTFNRNSPLYLGIPSNQRWPEAPTTTVEVPSVSYDEIKIWPEKILSARQASHLYNTDTSGVSPLEEIKGFTKGLSHSCAIVGERRVIKCWGNAANAQLGNFYYPDTTETPWPQIVLSLENMQEISAGNAHTCARANDNTLWCWGNNSLGNLGRMSQSANEPNPAQVKKIDGSILVISSFNSGQQHVCALDANKNVWCWGDNQNGQLGVIVSSPYYKTSANQVVSISDVDQISAGDQFSCALKADKTVWCWGEGRLGDGNNYTDETGYIYGMITPVQVRINATPTYLTDVTKVVAGAVNGCALKTDGTVWCWGNNGNGQIGDGSFSHRVYAKKVTKNDTSYLDNIIDLKMQGKFVCALASDKTVWCWGDSSSYQEGICCNTNDITRAVQIPNLTNVEALTTSPSGVGVIKSDQSAWNWGNNTLYQLGNAYMGKVPLSCAPVGVYDLAKYDNFYNDYDVASTEQQIYKVSCRYKGNAVLEDIYIFPNDDPPCPPDMEPGLIESVCSEREVRKKDQTIPYLVSCSGSYQAEADTDLPEDYWSKAPYNLITWQHLGGAESFDVYRYDEGEAKNTDDFLGTVLLSDCDEDGRCACYDRSAAEKNLFGQYKKYHYFIKANGPAGIGDYEFTNEAQLNCQDLNLAAETIFFLASPDCFGDPAVPGVQLILKNRYPLGTTYWPGEGNRLLISAQGGNERVTADEVSLGGEAGLGGRLNGATNIGASRQSNLSWAARRNWGGPQIDFNDSNCAGGEAGQGCTASFWIKFDNPTSLLEEAIFFNKEAADTYPLATFMRLLRQDQSSVLAMYTMAKSDQHLSYAHTTTGLSDTEDCSEPKNCWHHLRASWWAEADQNLEPRMDLWLDFEQVAENINPVNFDLGDPGQRRIYFGHNLGYNVTDWSASYTLNKSVTNALLYEPNNQVLYASNNPGSSNIIRCDLSSGCDETGDWQAAENTLHEKIKPIIYTENSTKKVLFAGVDSAAGVAKVFRCDLATGCDTDNVDWGDLGAPYGFGALDGGAYVYNDFGDMVFDSVNKVLYAGVSNGYILSCAMSSDPAVPDCDDAADWAQSAVGVGNISAMEFDSEHKVIYAANTIGAIYRCDATASGCFDWTFAWNNIPDPDYVSAMTFDSLNKIVYAGTNLGKIYRCNTNGETGCTAGVNDWPISIQTALSLISDMAFDAAHDVVYAVGYRAIDSYVYGCDIDSLCDTPGDWGITAVTGIPYVYSVAADSRRDGLTYIGTNYGYIYRSVSLTSAKASIDEVYLSTRGDNDPYYYEIFRKNAGDLTYSYIATLDSNAYQWIEDLDRNDLAENGKYDYKVRVVTTGNTYTGLVSSPQNVEVLQSCDTVTDDGPRFRDDTPPLSNCEGGQAKIELTWFDTKVPNIDNDYQIMISISPQEGGGTPTFEELTLDSHKPSDVIDLSYCGSTSSELQAAGLFWQCHFWYSGTGLSTYTFKVARNLESGEEDYVADEDNLTDWAIYTGFETGLCHDQPPSEPIITNTAACCSDGAQCNPLTNAFFPSISIIWQDAERAESYIIARNCPDDASDWNDCETYIAAVPDPQECNDPSDNPGDYCEDDADCLGSPGYSCGPDSYEYLDLTVVSGETYNYKVFALNNRGVYASELSSDVISPTQGGGGENDCSINPTRPVITSVKRVCSAGSSAHKINWDYINLWDPSNTFGDPNPFVTVNYWTIFARENLADSGSFDPSFDKLVNRISTQRCSNDSSPCDEDVDCTGGGNCQCPDEGCIKVFSNSDHFYLNTAISPGMQYNYNIYATDDEENWSDPSGAFGEVEIPAPICSSPPRRDIINLKTSQAGYSKCDEITLTFSIDSQMADDLAEGYEVYRLADLPDLTPQYFSDCQYIYYNTPRILETYEVLDCLYSGTSCVSSPNCDSTEYFKNKKISDQIKDDGLSGELIANFPRRGLTTYSFTDRGLSPGTYYWAVSSYNLMGYSTSTESNIFEFEIKNCAPAPLKTTVTAISKCPDSVELSWPNPAENATHYNIYRRELEGAVFELLTTEAAGGPVEACRTPSWSECANKYTDQVGPLTEIYKYKIVSVEERTEDVDGQPMTFLVESNVSVEKNARACFRLPRWQELPGVTP